MPNGTATVIRERRQCGFTREECLSCTRPTCVEDDCFDITRVCRGCKRYFTTRVLNQRFCSSHCRVQDERQRRNGGPPPRQCLTCGASLDNLRECAIFCSLSCRRKDMRIQQKWQRDALRPPRYCIVCGKHLVGFRPQAVYCGTSCKKKALSARYPGQRTKARRKKRSLDRVATGSSPEISQLPENLLFSLAAIYHNEEERVAVLAGSA